MPDLQNYFDDLELEHGTWGSIQCSQHGKREGSWEPWENRFETPSRLSVLQNLPILSPA